MDNNNKALYIETQPNNQCRISITPNTDAFTALQLLGTLASHILDAYSQAAYNTILEQDPAAATKQSTQAALEGIKLSLVDSLNTIMTNVINNFSPLRQSLIDQIEEQVIIDLTNQRIEEYYQSLPDNDKAAFQSTYNQMKEQLQTDASETNHA